MSNVLVRQGSTTSDGFLSSTEYAFWASTMKLQEDEAHPTLKQSQFLSLPNDLPPQVCFFLSLAMKIKLLCAHLEASILYIFNKNVGM